MSYISTSGGSVSVVRKTYSEAQSLIGSSGLKVGQKYLITDRADLGILLTATATNAFGLSGEGGFLNADFLGVGDYSGVTGFDSLAGQWNTTFGSITVDDSSDVAYGQSVQDETTGATATVYRIDSLTVYIKDINGAFVNGNTAIFNNEFEVTLTSDTALLNYYVTGNVVVFQDQGDGGWKHAVKLTDAAVSTRPESDGTNWSVLDKTVSGTGYIEAWDYIEFNFIDNIITRRSDKLGNTLRFKNSTDVISTGFPFGYGPTIANGVVVNCNIGPFSALHFTKPISYFANIVASEGGFSLTAEGPSISVYNSEFMPGANFEWAIDDYGSAPEITGLRMEAESYLGFRGTFERNNSVEACVIGPGCYIDTAGYAIYGSQFYAGVNVTLIRDVNQENISVNPVRDNNLDTQASRNAAIIADTSHLPVSTPTYMGKLTNMPSTDASGLAKVVVQSGGIPVSFDHPSAIFGADIIAYYDANTISAADGDPVTSQDDTSGNGYDLTPSGSYTPPMAGTDPITGKRVIDFSENGTVHDLQNVSFTWPTGAFTLVTVVKPANNFTYFNGIIGNLTNFKAFGHSFQGPGVNHFSTFSWYENNKILCGLIDADHTYFVSLRAQSNTTAIARVDSRTPTTTTGTDDGGMGTGFVLGYLRQNTATPYRFAGLHFLTFVVNRDITDTEVKRLNDWVKNEYQIAEMSFETFSPQTDNIVEVLDNTEAVIASMDEDGGWHGPDAVDADGYVTKSQMDAVIVPSIESIDLTAQVADISATTFATSGVGTYMLTYELIDTLDDLTAGTVQLSITYNDGTPRTDQSATVTLTVANTRDRGSFYIVNDSGNIQYSVTSAGIYGTSTYRLAMSLLKLS